MTTAPPTVALAVFTDGRDDLLARTVDSAAEHLAGPIAESFIFDDTGDYDHYDRLRRRYGDGNPYPFRVVATSPGERLGFAGAIRSAWRFLRAWSTSSHIFHLEDDFVFAGPVDIWQMLAVLDTNPDLVNLALRRQPWNDAERAAGGIVEQHPDAYTDCTSPDGGVAWLEHRLFFTTNPGVYRRDLIMGNAWPTGPESEGRFTHHLLADPAARFGYFGSRSSGEAVEHIGHDRVGVGY